MSDKKTVGQPLPGPGKLRLGDVIAIPLGNNRFGYARVYRDVDFAILDKVSDGVCNLNDIIGLPVRFFVTHYEPYGVSPWIYLGKWRFDNPDNAWGPPTYVRDVIDPTQVRIMERGVMRDATESEIEGLREATLQDPNGIRDRIIEEFGLEMGHTQREKR